MSITLYNLHGSPPCGFIQALAQLLGIVLNVKDLNFAEREHLSPEYLKINPFHKVPAIDDNGFILYESSAIAYYLLRKYAPESELYPANITTRARIDQTLAVLSSNLHPQTAVFYRPRHYFKTKPSAEEVAAFEQNVIKGFEHLLGDGKFAVGDTLTIADLSLVSHLTLALEINPFHKIPSFSDDGFIIYESSAICYYLLRKHAPDSELYPNCNRGRARIDQALATITSTIQPHYFKFMIPRFYELKKPTAEEVEAFEEHVIKGFEKVLGDGNYVLGDKLSLADLSLVAHLTLVLELPLLEAQKYPKLKSYYDRLKAELPYFEEINEPGISALKSLATQMK